MFALPQMKPPFLHIFLPLFSNSSPCSLHAQDIFELSNLNGLHHPPFILLRAISAKRLLVSRAVNIPFGTRIGECSPVSFRRLLQRLGACRLWFMPASFLAFVLLNSLNIHLRNPLPFFFGGTAECLAVSDAQVQEIKDQMS